MSSYWNETGKYQQDLKGLQVYIPKLGVGNHDLVNLLSLALYANYDMNNNGDLQLSQEDYFKLLQRHSTALLDTGEVTYDEYKEYINVLRRAGTDRSTEYVREFNEEHPGIADKVISAIVVLAKKHEHAFLPAKTLNQAIEDSGWESEKVLEKLKAFLGSDPDMKNRAAYFLQEQLREEQRPKVRP